MKKFLGYLEPWYLLIASLGLVEGGINIIMMPQHIAQTLPDGKAVIGLMMGVWCLGALMGPVLGRMVDRFGMPRWSLAIVLAAAAAIQWLLLQTTHMALWVVLMWLLGVTFFGGLTLFNMLIVRRFPEKEWHWRTSLMMFFFVGGEVVGFAVAAYFPTPAAGILAGSGMLLLTGILTLVLAPAVSCGTMNHKAPVKLDRKVLRLLTGSSFGLFLLAWGWMNFSAQLLFLPFPVLFREVFNLLPAASAKALSLGAGSSLIWYLVIGKLSERLGAIQLLLYSSACRVFIFATLAWLAFDSPSASTVTVLIVLYRQTWPFMLTSAQVAANQLAPDEVKGMAIGIFNATTGVMNAVSGVALSGLTLLVGMRWMPAIATVGLIIGVVLLAVMLLMQTREKKSAASAG